MKRLYKFILVSCVLIILLSFSFIQAAYLSVVKIPQDLSVSDAEKYVAKQTKTLETTGKIGWGGVVIATTGIIITLIKVKKDKTSDFD